MGRVFNIVGVSRTRDGQPLKLRVANGIPSRRARTLERAGQADIHLFQVDPPISKDESLKWLQDNQPDIFARIDEEKDIKADRQPRTRRSNKSSSDALIDAIVQVIDEALTPAAREAVRRAHVAERIRTAALQQAKSTPGGNDKKIPRKAKTKTLKEFQNEEGDNRARDEHGKFITRKRGRPSKAQKEAEAQNAA